MESIMENIEKELKHAERAVSKLELQMAELNGRLEEWKDRVAMLQDMRKNAESIIAEGKS